MNHHLRKDQHERVGVGPSRSFSDIQDSILTILGRSLLSSKGTLRPAWVVHKGAYGT